MTTVRLRTCDGCGTSIPEGGRCWGVSVSSIDFPSPPTLTRPPGFRHVSTHWDGCDECAEKTRTAIRTVLREPSWESPAELPEAVVTP